MAYPAYLLTLPALAQQKAIYASLRCAWPLSMMLNCFHAGHFAIQYVAPGRSPHMPFMILPICPGTNITWMNITYTSSQGTWISAGLGLPAQSSRSNPNSIPNQAQCPVLWGCRTYVYFIPQLTICLLLCQAPGSPVCWYQYTSVSLGLSL